MAEDAEGPGSGDAINGLYYVVLPLNSTSAVAQTIMGIYASVLALAILIAAFFVQSYKPIVLIVGVVLFFVAAGLLWGAAHIRGTGKRAREARDDRLRSGGFLVGEEPTSTVPVAVRDEDAISWFIEKTRMPLVGSRWARKTKPIEAFKHLCAELELNGLVLPQTIADERLKRQLDGVALTRDLLEPEYVPHIPQTLQVLTGVFGGGLAWGSGNLIQSGYGWLAAILLAVGCALVIATLVHVRGRSILLHVMEPFSPVAGVGVIRDQRRRRWAIGDSILVLQCGLRGNYVLATLFGPEGTLRWSFKNLDHPDFRLLWQRWNHPLPRPELME